MVSSSMMFTGFGALVVGAVGYRYGYQLSRFSEQMDAIGSTTPASEVEPAGWKVMLTRLGSAVLGAIGALMVLMSLFQA